MLRSLAIRNFVVVEALDVEFDAGLTVLTGETGAGKSILLDALGLLLGDRFELRQLRPGAERAELAATFDIADAPAVGAWLAEHELAAEGDEVLLRRVLDAQGKSRAWINGRPATLAQLKELGERLVDIHGQHAHQSLAEPEAQRGLIDAFGGFTTLAREVGERFRAWRVAQEQSEAAAHASAATATEREFLDGRRRELAALAVTEAEWGQLSATQSRLANAADLITAASEGALALSDGDDALTVRVAQLTQRLRAAAAHDAALADVVALLDPAAIQLDEAARALRDYQRRLDLDPDELKRVEDRLSAIHDMARKHRVRPEALPALLAETEARLAALAEAADAQALAARAERSGEAVPPAGRASRQEAPLRRQRTRPPRHRHHATARDDGRAARDRPRAARRARELWPGAGRVPRREPSEAAARAARARRVGRGTVARGARHPGRGERSGPGAHAGVRRGRQRHRRRRRGHRRAPAAGTRHAAAGAVRDAPAAGGGLRRRALSRDANRATAPA